VGEGDRTGERIDADGLAHDLELPPELWILVDVLLVLERKRLSPASAR
jgi:hypothetical protein